MHLATRQMTAQCRVTLRATGNDCDPPAFYVATRTSAEALPCARFGTRVDCALAADRWQTRARGDHEVAAPGRVTAGSAGVHWHSHAHSAHSAIVHVPRCALNTLVRTNNAHLNVPSADLSPA